VLRRGEVLERGAGLVKREHAIDLRAQTVLDDRAAHRRERATMPQGSVELEQGLGDRPRARGQLPNFT
jgi:hypothetical protein